MNVDFPARWKTPEAEGTPCKAALYDQCTARTYDLPTMITAETWQA
jgi:hypothetical protein